MGPSRVLKRSRHTWFTPRLWLRRLVFWSGAVCVGAVAIGFAIGAERANGIHQRMIALSPFFPFVVSPLGLALVALMTRRLFPGSQGSGIPQTIAALRLRELAARNAVLSLRIALGKIFLTLLGLCSGASVGREGPTVQIGAAIMHSLGRLVRFPRREMERGLILAGGAAGVAAAFNTPLAGIVFAIEEMSRSFEQSASGTVLTAVIIAGVLSLALLGNYTYFGHTSVSLSTDRSWIAVLVCGGAGGLVGGLFSQLLIGSSRGLPGPGGRFMREKPVAFAAACGLALALIGFVSDGTTYGTGYHEARGILEGSASLPHYYGALKMLATIVSYLSGIPGGIFAPSLAAGAGFGSNLAALMPYAPAGAVVILGMVAFFSGVIQAPITAFVIVIELTDNHDMVLPLMAAALIAHAASRTVCHKSLYRALAESFLKGAGSGGQ